MGKYYKTTPWVIPELPQSLKNIFKKNGKKISIRKNQVISGNDETALFSNTEKLIYIDSGLLGQAYKTYCVNKPYAMSIVLPGRMVNYLHYLEIDNSGDIILALRKSDIFTMTKSQFDGITEKDLKDEMVRYCKKAVTSDFDAMCCMFTCDTPQRLAYFLKALAESFYDDISTMPLVEIPLKLSYAEMSYIMHTTIRTIERLLPKWRSMGYISTRRNSLIIYK
ncbi:MAG TPA: hypothetical protein DCX03_02035, partial [Bacteroidales bacterium]|nr:hypothetical protein [Bacteroidales bacterium]